MSWNSIPAKKFTVYEITSRMGKERVWHPIAYSTLRAAREAAARIRCGEWGNATIWKITREPITGEEQP